MSYNSNTISCEQRRTGKTNNDMAKLLNCSRPTYERKKKTGQFTATEAKTLCQVFNCDFYYLFGDE